MNALAEYAADVAMSNLGHGEEGRNNDGHMVRVYTGGTAGNWCAAFQSWCFETAAVELDWEGPVPKRSHGALRFCRNVAALGRFIDTAKENPQKGDVIAWYRGRIRTWRGHVAIVVAYIEDTDTLVTVEGNKGRFPAVVSVQVYYSGSWRKKLYNVARMDSGR